MTVAKRIRKKDESWQDALKRAKLEMVNLIQRLKSRLIQNLKNYRK